MRCFEGGDDIVIDRLGGGKWGKVEAQLDLESAVYACMEAETTAGFDFDDAWEKKIWARGKVASFQMSFFGWVSPSTWF